MPHDIVQVGLQHHKSGDEVGAAACYTAAIVGSDSAPTAWQNLSVMAARDGYLTVAAVMMRKALQTTSNRLSALSNLGNILWRIGEFAEAEAVLLEAQDLGPSEWIVQHNLGLLNLAQGRFDLAIEHMKRAMGTAPREMFSKICNDMGCATLAAGDLGLGFKLTEPEWNMPNTPVWLMGFPEWTGKEDLKGARILVHHNQGAGDTLQFCRFLPKLRALGPKRVIVAVPYSLKRIVQESFNWLDVVDINEALPKADLHVGMGTLPVRLGITRDDVKGDRYLRAGVVASKSKSIGIVWSANQKNRTGKERSIPLEAMLQLALVPGAKLYSLQVGDAVADIERLGADLLVKDLSPRIRDFYDLACLMQGMDLVVSADTAPLHLAAGLGFPCLGLMSYVGADWRWGARGTETSYWYSPKLKLVWQQNPNEPWTSVVSRAMELIEL